MSQSGHKTDAFIDDQLAIKSFVWESTLCIDGEKKIEEFKHVQLFVEGLSATYVDSYDNEACQWEDKFD